MSSDPAYHLFLNECSSTIGKSDGNASSNKVRENVAAVLTLLREDHTVPFIARYRREQTGDIEVSDLYELQRKWDDFVSMAKLRQSRIASLDASGRLTEDIRKAFNECICKEDLDELYSAYKETKTAKSEVMHSFQVEEVAHDFVEGKLRHTSITSKMAEIASSTKYSVAEAIVYHCTNHLFADLDVKATAKEQFHRFPTLVNTALTPAYKSLQKELQDGGGKSGRVTQSKHTSKDASAAPPPKASEMNKYRDYHSVHRRISQLPAHQLLAIRRGKEAGVLNITLSPDENAKTNILRFMHQKFKCFPSSQHTDSSAALKLTAAGSKILREDVMSLASKEAVSKLCAASTKKQWKDAMTAAEVEAAEVFSTSLRPLLLTAPLRLVVDRLRQQSLTDAAPQIVVCAVDPGFAHGHKWVILSQGHSSVKTQDTSVRAKGEDTNILCYGKIFEKSSSSSVTAGVAGKTSPIMLQSASQLAELLQRYKVDVVAIGNGTASREAQMFVGSALQHLTPSSSRENVPSEDKASAKAAKRKRDDAGGSENTASTAPTGVCLGYVVVSEAGASVYSASERAREEFPPDVLDISYVGAVSIGRRLVDPLSELVKVQPASLGVGMYQHDLSDKGITERLRNVVEDCVNTVGIDINAASSDLLRYVSGLSEANVREIIAHRSASTEAPSASTGSTTAASSAKAKKGTAAGSAGRLECLADLKRIKGIGPKTFRNCAGFMRVYNGSEPLDVTNIHPDDYEVARLMLELHRSGRVGSADGAISSSKKQKGEKGEKVEKAEVVDSTSDGEGSCMWTAFLRAHSAQDGSAASGEKKKKQGADPYAVLRSKSAVELTQIWTWLLEAGLVRESSSKASLAPAVMQGPFMSLPKVQRGIPEDFHVKIEVGSVVHGVIRNVTTFGAFVDLGGVEIGDSKSENPSKGKGKVSCDGLLHCSKYRDYVKRQPAGAQLDVSAMSKEIYVGREVKVKILTIEEVDGCKESGKGGHHEKRRIALDLMELL